MVASVGFERIIEYKFTKLARLYYETDASTLAQTIAISTKAKMNVLKREQVGKNNVVPRKITDASHPAYGQHGLFTTRKIQPGQHILDYIGFIHTETESDPRSDYDIRFFLAPSFQSPRSPSTPVLETEWISIDAANMGNEARFINDFRGIAERPNVEFRDYVLDCGHGRFQRRMGVFCLTKPIAKSQELVVTYGKGFWLARNYGSSAKESNDGM